VDSHPTEVGGFFLLSVNDSRRYCLVPALEVGRSTWTLIEVYNAWGGLT